MFLFYTVSLDLQQINFYDKLDKNYHQKYFTKPMPEMVWRNLRFAESQRK